jgi:hypothetical protein
MFTPFSVRLALVGAFLCGGLFLSGCTGESQVKVYPVTGKLTKGGEPLGGVIITFYPSDGTSQASSGEVDDSGNFTLTCADGRPGAVAGKHKVLLEAKFGEEIYESSGPPPEPPFPGEYSNRDTTPKEVDVAASETNNFTIDIE